MLAPLSIPACPTLGAFENHGFAEAIVTQSIESGLRFRHRPVGMLLDSRRTDLDLTSAFDD